MKKAKFRFLITVFFIVFFYGSNPNSFAASEPQPWLRQYDIAVVAFSLSEESCKQGTPVTARARIKNLGQDTLNAVLCTIGPSQRSPFYVKILPVFDPGEEVEISTTLPALFVGDHIIEACVDGKNIFQETNEDNNVKSATLHVEPLTKEDVKLRAAGFVTTKINQAMAAINAWLRNLGKPRQ